MRGGHLDSILRHLRHLVGGCPGEHSDGRLLERFLEQHDEAAFTALVARHGPMVWGVCRRLLSDHDAEDAFQATFLVLVRRARGLDRRGSLAGWLHEVAARVSLRARASRGRERPLTDEEVPAMNATDPATDAARHELRTLIDEELRRLPEKYRGPLLLCDVQGRSHEEAARQLGCPVGSMSWRLARGRELLRRGLERRGVSLPAAMLAALLCEEAVAMPAAVAEATVRTAVLLAAGGAGALPGPVAALVDGTLRALGMARLKMVAVLAVLGLLAAGAGLVTHRVLTADQTTPPHMEDRAANAEGPSLPAPPAKEDEKKPQPAAVQPAPLVDRHGDPLPPGAVVRLGTLRLRQADAIAAFAFSPDGKALATAGESDDEWLHIWDVESGKMVRRLPESGVSALAFSPDGKLLAVASQPGKNDSRRHRVWDLETGAQRCRLDQIYGLASTLVFSPDGTKLFAGEENRIAAWDTSTGKRLTSYLDDPILTFTLAPDGKSLSAIVQRGKKIVFEPIDQSARVDFAKGGCTFSKLTFSRDGKRLAVTSDDGQILLLDATTHKEIGDVESPRPESILSFAFTPNGKELLAVDQQQQIWAWDADTGKSLRPCTPPFGFTLSAAFSPDCQLIAFLDHHESTDQHAVRLFDRAAGKERHRLGGHESGVCSVAFSPDGSTVASTGTDGVTILWDIAAARELWRVAGAGEHIGSVAFAPSGRVLATGGASGRVELIDAATGKSQVVFGPETAYGRSLAFSPDGKTLAVSGHQSRLSFWSVDNAKAQDSFPSAAREVVFDRTGRCAAAVWGGASVGGSDKPGSRWLRIAKFAGTTSVALAADGAALAIGVWDEGNVYLFDPDSGKERARLQLGDETLRCVALSSSGRIVATGGAKGSVRLFDATTGAEWLRLAGHEGPINAISFSADGRRLATAGGDTTVLIWDLARVWQIEQQFHLAPERSWDDLDSPDGTVALRAAAALAANPGGAVALLKERLKRVPLDHTERLRRAVADLQDEDYQVRDRALAELRGFGGEAIPLLLDLQRRTTDRKLQARLRAFLTLAELEGISPPPPQGSRAVLAVQILEGIGSPEARQVLEDMAQGRRLLP